MLSFCESINAHLEKTKYNLIRAITRAYALLILKIFPISTTYSIFINILGMFYKYFTTYFIENFFFSFIERQKIFLLYKGPYSDF